MHRNTHHPLFVSHFPHLPGMYYRVLVPATLQTETLLSISEYRYLVLCFLVLSHGDVK